MQVAMDFDEGRMRRYAERGAEVVFSIAFENDGTYYPVRGWVDFGTVILMWWSAAFLRVLNGAREDEFEFMDGPYAMRVRGDPSTGEVELTPRGEAYSWRTTLAGLGTVLARAMEEVARKLSELQLDEKHQVGLQNAARIRRAAAAARPG
jgi:hypothetical protein